MDINLIFILFFPLCLFAGGMALSLSTIGPFVERLSSKIVCPTKRTNQLIDAVISVLVMAACGVVSFTYMAFGMDLLIQALVMNNLTLEFGLWNVVFTLIVGVIMLYFALWCTGVPYWPFRSQNVVPPTGGEASKRLLVTHICGWISFTLFTKGGGLLFFMYGMVAAPVIYISVLLFERIYMRLSSVRHSRTMSAYKNPR